MRYSDRKTSVHALRKTILRAAFGALSLAALLPSIPARADLAAYLAKPEPAYKWSQKSLTTDGNWTVQTLSMVSQTWQGSPWTHQILVVRPAKPTHPELCLLLNTGRENPQSQLTTACTMAAAAGCTMAVLFDVPNQPLYGKEEDALIVYSWQKYVETGDEGWPLQFPMTKSVIKAMDAIQAAAKEAKQPEVTKFIITGASKRGWTAWLAGASGDKRIVGIAPMVFDMLNMPRQVPHQLEMYGKPSEQIHDYSQGGMLQLVNTAPGKRIIAMVDPYSFRDKLTMPKLLILGTNDRYWSQDALNLYWDDLKGPKWVLYDPNSGHGLEDVMRLLTTVSAFTRSVAAGKSLPTPTWRWADDATGATITVKSDQPLRAARLFRVESATRDFRDSKWTSTEVTAGKATLTAHAPAPATGYAATFVELGYEQDGKPYTVSTQMRILSAKP